LVRSAPTITQFQRKISIALSITPPGKNCLVRTRYELSRFLLCAVNVCLSVV
jgi:hypothetical protein